MLAPRHAAKLRRERRWGLLALGGFALMFAAIIKTVVTWPSVWMVVGATATTFGLVVFSLVPISVVRATPDTIRPVYDRRVPFAQTDEERGRLRDHFTLHAGDIDARLRELGLEPLDHYLEFRLAPGIARHDPEQARRNISSLLEQADSTLDDMTRRALEMLARDLEEAARHGARFCLMPINMWSGWTESSLQLYIG